MSVTVSVKSILLAAVVLLALVTAYLLGGGTGQPVAAPAAAAAPEQTGTEDGRRVVRMMGGGEVSAVPDQMTFALSVTAKRFDLGEALAASSATMRRVLAELEEHGVEKSDVQTTGLTMYPEYEYHSYAPPTLTGYRVTQKARVEVDELSEGGRAVTAAVETGGNGVRVRDIRLGIGDTEALLGEARARAVEAATAKAEQYAAATGQALGPVVSIQEVGSATRRVVQTQSLSYDRAARDLAAFPVRAGKDDLAVRIQVVWELA